MRKATVGCDRLAWPRVAHTAFCCPFSIENVVLCWKQRPERFATRHSTTNEAAPTSLVSGIHAGSSETRVDVNLCFGSRLQALPWSIHLERLEMTRRVKLPLREMFIQASQLARSTAKGPQQQKHLMVRFYGRFTSSGIHKPQRFCSLCAAP